MIYFIRSDVHLNPAVTIGVLIAGGLEVKKAICYIFMQLIGGIIAAGMFRVKFSYIERND